MARYILDLNDGSKFSVDDYQVNGSTIEYIEPYSHARRFVDASKVNKIREAVGFERGILGGLSQGPTLPKK